MHAETARAVSLVSYGNAALQGLVDPDSVDWANRSMFRHVHAIEFRMHRSWAGIRTPLSHAVARTPSQWFQWLANRRTAHLELILTRHGEWAIRITRESKREWWTWRVRYAGDRLDGRVWDVIWRGHTTHRAPRGGSAVDPITATDNLRLAVDRVAAIARVCRAHAWGTRFAEALAMLDGELQPIPYFRDLLAVPTPAVQRLVTAALHVWVFTAMPSPRYSGNLSGRHADVFSAVAAILRDPAHDAVVAAANSALPEYSSDVSLSLPT